MAKKLKEYKRKELRCLVIENMVSGEVFKVVDLLQMEQAQKEYSEWEITKIYNPTQKQKNDIWEMASKQENENDLTVGLQGIDMMLKAIPMLTDIEVDLTIEEDFEMLKEVIEDPNRVMELVAQEINSMLLDITNDYINNLKAIAKLPEDLLQELVKSNG